MSYQVLARKWRPREFTDMVGQSHVLKALTSALSQQRLHHAYLFTGTRGVGKTTVARIFAKALNCEEGVSATPCGQCSSCVEVDGGRFVDLIEVDAASRTKVEDTRDLLENVQYLPTRGRYKVYLIDEVHMLSNSSFNALLKTLEEPPAHVMFLLATTDPQKMPVTVLSRCLQFHLKALTPDQIVARLQHILVAEKVAFEDATLPMVAKAANGSLRDALSLLDQAIAHGQGVLKADDVRDMLGFVEHTSLAGLVQAIAEQDVAAVMSAVQAMEAYSPDYQAVIDELLSVLHGAAVAQQLPESSYAENPLCHQLSTAVDAETLQLYYQIALHGKRDLPLAPSPKEGLEMCLLRLMVFTPSSDSAASHSVKKPEAAVSNKPVKPAAASVTAAQQSSREAHAATPATVETSPQESVPEPQLKQAATSVAGVVRTESTGLRALASQWLAWLDAMAVPGLLDNLARHCALIEQKAHMVVLAAEPQRIEMLNGERKRELEAALSQQLGQAIQIQLSEGIPDGALTPTQLSKEREAAKRAAAEQSLKNDPRLQELLDLSEGRLLVETIRSLN